MENKNSSNPNFSAKKLKTTTQFLFLGGDELFADFHFSRMFWKTTLTIGDGLVY
jgi:hypothetical protein